MHRIAQFEGGFAAFTVMEFALLLSFKGIEAG